MNPWGTLNDWQRFEVDERVRRYGPTPGRRLRARSAAPATTAPVPQTSPRWAGTTSPPAREQWRPARVRW